MRYFPLPFLALFFLFFVDSGMMAGKTSGPDLTGEFTLESAYSHYIATMNTRKAGLLVHIWREEGGVHQRLRAIDAGGGFYVLQFCGNNLCLDINEKGMIRGSDRSGSDSQKWKFESAGGGGFRLLSKSAGKYLDVLDGDTNMGAYLTVATERETDSQKWLVFPDVTIFGKLSLPEGVTAPAGGIRADLKAFDVGGELCPVVIPEGSNSAAYRMVLPYCTRTIYRVKYVYWGAGYKRCAYWTKDGTKQWGSKSPGWQIDCGGHDADSIDLALLPDNDIVSRDEENRLADKKADEIVKTITRPEMTEFEKALAVNDYIAGHFTFFNESDCEANPIRTLEDIWEPYGILVLNCTTCAGYSWTADKLLTLAGVKTERINNWNHSWNLVQVDGGTYHIDTVASYGYGGFLRTTAELTNNPWAIQHEAACSNADSPFAFKDSDYPHKKWLVSGQYRRIIGTLKLPAGMVSPSGGVNVTVNGVSFHIPQGQKEIFFMLREKLDGNSRTNGFVVRYHASYPVIGDGFYAGIKTVENEKAALRIPAGDEDITGVTIVMLRRKLELFTLYNSTAAGYLFEKNGMAHIGTGNEKYRLWFFEDVDGFRRIRNYKTGDYLHIQDRKDYIECGPNIPDGYWSAQWQLKKYGSGRVVIINRWQPEWMSVRKSAGSGGDYASHPETNSEPDSYALWQVEKAEEK